ncbi:cell division control protein 14, SIN component-domain-containing protein [Russula aff. rugulosa BPL654]|nr:cell division control protein 14, SIN component-domain-containing protein [Russula aff. rugulosa BPL654]
MKPFRILWMSGVGTVIHHGTITSTRKVRTSDYPSTCFPRRLSNITRISVASEYLRVQRCFADHIMDLWGKSSSRCDPTTRALDGQREAEASVLSSQLAQALSIIQGVALTHHSTKAFLGRKYPFDVLLDLLIISRHLASPLPASKQPTPSDEVHTHNEEAVPPSVLPNAVLDTLLCILVDSSRSLRVFEDCSGVQTIVKLLKRAHTPRDVRMKCLEFLYFYLMDETSPRPDLSIGNVEHIHPPPVSLPPSPTKPRYFPQTSRNPSSSSDDSLTSSGSSRSSSTSESSATSLSSSSTPAHTRFLSVIPKTPPSPTKPPTQSYTKPRTLLMLQKEVDFMPVTPKKSHVSRLGIGLLRPSSAPSSPFKNFRATPDEANTETDYRSGNSFTSERDHVISKPEDRDVIKTTEQKKEFLGFMLGNVDALVEGVKRAGVWGLA